jgi:hypothetical protein
MENINHFEGNHSIPKYRPLFCHYLDKNTVENEINSFILPNDVARGFIDILSEIIYCPNSSLFWVAGTIGSGKTYFLKYIYYLLNKNTSLKSFIKFKSLILDDPLLNSYEINRLEERISTAEIDAVMFNLLNVRDWDDIGSVFFDQFNKFRGYNDQDIQLAILLEKQLGQKGKLEEFKRQIKSELNVDWEIDAVVIFAFQLHSVLEIAKKICPEIDIASIENQLSNSKMTNFELKKLLGIEIKEYLKDKKENYRLIFIVDNLLAYNFNPESNMLEIKDLFYELTSIDFRIKVIISSHAVDEDHKDNFNMIKLRDKLFGYRFHLSILK